jgi:hypothetical protein
LGGGLPLRRPALAFVIIRGVSPAGFLVIGLPDLQPEAVGPLRVLHEDGVDAAVLVVDIHLYMAFAEDVGSKRLSLRFSLRFATASSLLGEGRTGCDEQQGEQDCFHGRETGCNDSIPLATYKYV